MKIEPLVLKLNFKITPIEAFRRLSGLHHLFFLDGGTTGGKFSFLSGDPCAFLELQNGNLCSKGLKNNNNLKPLDSLKEIYRSVKLKNISGLPSFQGGLAGLWGYGLNCLLENIPLVSDETIESPDFALGLYDWSLGFDLTTEEAYIFSTGLPETETSQRLQRADKRLNQILQGLQNGTTKINHEWVPVLKYGLQNKVPQKDGFLTDVSMSDYCDGVAKCVNYIHAGDCFQINYTQRFWYPAYCSDKELYLHIRKECPAPYSGYFETTNGAIISASPERFIWSDGSNVTTKPIKGTRKRGSSTEEDEKLANDLVDSPKDRAENVMIVDLLRNDLGKSCKFGSVKVDEICKLESYSNVHHLVSSVSGVLKDGFDNFDLLLGCFPGGSVTGAPKVRAMQIIAELEKSPRGIYCGSLGYLGFNGAMDTNILIRSIYSSRGWLQFGSGGGIVSDSVPQSEYQEMLTKASGLIRAIKNHPLNKLKF